MNRDVLQKVFLGLLAGGMVFFLQRNLRGEREETSPKEAPPAEVAETAPELSEPQPVAQVETDASPASSPSTPAITLQRGSTRQEVLDVLGEPSGSMAISGIETLYYGDLEVKIKHGVVVKIPEDLSSARSASAKAAESRKQVAENRANQQAARKVAAKQAAAQPKSRANVTISNGGKLVSLSTLTGKGSVTIVDFYADWCGPCRQIDPHLKKMAHDPNVNLVKIDIVRWDTPVTKQHNITSVPHVRVYDAKGRQVGTPTSNPNRVAKYVEQAKGRS